MIPAKKRIAKGCWRQVGERLIGSFLRSLGLNWIETWSGSHLNEELEPLMGEAVTVIISHRTQRAFRVASRWAIKTPSFLRYFDKSQYRCVYRLTETLSSGELSEQLEQLNITVTAVTTPIVRYTCEWRNSYKTTFEPVVSWLFRQMHCIARPTWRTRCVIRIGMGNFL